jgi:hypothetical protein
MFWRGSTNSAYAIQNHSERQGRRTRSHPGNVCILLSAFRQEIQNHWSAKRPFHFSAPTVWPIRSNALLDVPMLEQQITQVVASVDQVSADYLGDKIELKYPDTETASKAYDVLLDWWRSRQVPTDQTAENESKKRRRARFQELLEEFEDEI